MATAKNLLEQALELPRADRASLARDIIASLDEPLEPAEDVQAAWLEEVERRLIEVDAGRAKTVPWDEVRRQIATRLRQG